MEDLTFGEQVKIILSRKGMTIKELAETIEARTGKKMSRQNLTQRLGRDNFQEQDMRMIAEILERPFQLSILSGEPIIEKKQKINTAAYGAASEKLQVQEPEEEQIRRQSPMHEIFLEQEPEEAEALPIGVTEGQMDQEEHDMTIGEVYDIHRELTELEKNVEAGEAIEEVKEELRQVTEVIREPQTHTEDGSRARFANTQELPDDFAPVIRPNDLDEDLALGELNPYTGHEYHSNSVRMHPQRIGYVQVYDRASHSWTDMTEWAFLGYQERQKVLLGKEYEPPIYLD